MSPFVALAGFVFLFIVPCLVISSVRPVDDYDPESEVSLGPVRR